DAELLEAVSLNIDESSLTGEPLCAKTVDFKDFDPEATFPSNHVMRGTKVMEGHGIARVFAVGDKTENGKVFEAAQIDDSVKTPLNEQLDRLGDLITKASYGFAALILVGRLLMYFSSQNFVLVEFVAYLLQTFMIAVTLIVVAVPEGLPMAVTLSLAYSMRRMLKTNNLVRKMHACETMGAVTTICTDKTGTLTKNQMNVEQADFYGFNGDFSSSKGRLLAQSLACNATAELDLSSQEKPVGIGNPTEAALLLWLRRHGLDYRTLREEVRVVAELPFTTINKYMATVIEVASGEQVLLVKGAPEIVLEMCDKVENDEPRTKIRERLLTFQEQAMRTLGFAAKTLGKGEEVIVDGKLVVQDLVFLGITGISDPVRPDVPKAVQECFDAGIKVKIVTGDTPGTAREIGRQLGLCQEKMDPREIITGPEFAALTDEELKGRVGDLKIIARARPLDKERLVRALQQNNEVVAVTGDGTNDAPALHAAHVGLSMGDGTSVAKEASDITIIDNSFASIGRAVMWGRSLYKNIQRFILFQMTVNVAACFTVLAGAFMGTESPLTVTQMLWINLIMDTFAAMALASLPPSAEVMQETPRSRESFIITRPVARSILGVGVAFFVFLVSLVWLLEHSSVNSFPELLQAKIGPADGLSPYELSLFFTIFVMLQFWNMFNARAYDTGASALKLKNCNGFVIISALILLGQIVIINIGAEFFNVVPLKMSDWFYIICASSVVLWFGEILRFFSRKVQPAHS
ncbi:MAG: calcium-translocating P-type ATPase, PMCA-type, partial [Desulfovibrio sp.]|nr:calcium-translocating P-type ATPase, PMCA-type [Desulfovibrio sp.]